VPTSFLLLTEVLHTADKRQNNDKFLNAKMNELAGLAKRGVFKIVWKEEIPDNANVLGSRFVLSIKNKDSDEEIYKARFVVQGHKDFEKTHVSA